MGRRRGGGGGGAVTYTPNVGLAQQNINAQNQARVYGIQKEFLDFNRKRSQSLNDYQNQLNNLDFGSYDLQNANSAEKQQAALNAIRGGGTNSNQSQSAYEQNLKAQEEYRNKINNLINEQYTYNYNPVLQADGYTADEGFASQQRAKSREISDYIGGQNKIFGDSVSEYYSELDKRRAERAKPKNEAEQAGKLQSQANAGIGVAQSNSETIKQNEEEQKKIAVSPLKKKSNFFSGGENTNDIGIAQGYGGQSNSI